MARPREFDPNAALDVAVDTFWERGFEATSIQNLCRDLKLNPGSLYGAYGDKRTLFGAILDRYVEKVSREAIERIASNPSGLAGIRSYFDFLIAAMVDGKRKWGCLITNTLVELAAREPDIAVKVELHFARLETAFASALTRAKAAGELNDGAGPEMAPYLVCVVQGLNVLARTRPSRARLRAIVDAALYHLGSRPPLTID
jgi:TetR/AcrR family transcriptional regulator, transcriptional repressor for nem operon